MMVDCENCRFRFILANAFDIHVNRLDCDKYGTALCKEMNKPEFINGMKERKKMGRIICVEGYKAFTGWMRVSWKNRNPEDIHGDWLYKPDTLCWYCRGRSYPEEICKIVEISNPTKVKIMDILLDLYSRTRGAKKTLISEIMDAVRRV